MSETAEPAEPARSPFGPDFQVGDRRVRPALNRIEGPAGAVSVEPRVMEVLVHLAGRRGEVVSKEELVRAVWEGRFVSDDVVWRSIRELRRALGDDARSATWIRTIPRRGYVLEGHLACLAVALRWPRTGAPDRWGAAPPARGSAAPRVALGDSLPGRHRLPLR